MLATGQQTRLVKIMTVINYLMESNLLWYRSKGHEVNSAPNYFGGGQTNAALPLFSDCLLLPARFKRTVKTLLRHFLWREPARLIVGAYKNGLYSWRVWGKIKFKNRLYRSRVIKKIISSRFFRRPCVKTHSQLGFPPFWHSYKY